VERSHLLCVVPEQGCTDRQRHGRQAKAAEHVAQVGRLARRRLQKQERGGHARANEREAEEGKSEARIVRRVSGVALAKEAKLICGVRT
jgi:hypothetical protein